MDTGSICAQSQLCKLIMFSRFSPEMAPVSNHLTINYICTNYLNDQQDSPYLFNKKRGSYAERHQQSEKSKICQ